MDSEPIMPLKPPYTMHLGRYLYRKPPTNFSDEAKKETVKKRIYKNRKLAIEDVSDDIDMFYNGTRRHQHLGGVSPDEFEAATKHA